MTLVGPPVALRERPSRFWPALLWAALILVGTSWPNITVGPDITGLDKVVHFGMYGGFAYLLLRASRYRAAWGRVMIVLACVAVFGLIDEVHQDYIPGRSASLADWFADILGGATGAVLSHVRARPTPSTPPLPS
ncbi:MAG: hypothetical protein RLZZ63_1282 [Gemmatimonadota bacterium]|jgi:hypothetical protein